MLEAQRKNAAHLQGAWSREGSTPLNNVGLDGAGVEGDGGFKRMENEDPICRPL